jgi:Putative peptidoglycan binding domain/LysM domain
MRGERFGDVEIEVHAGPATAAAREASERELRQLVYRFKYRDPQARRVVAELLGLLGGLPSSHVLRQLEPLDVGSPRAEAFGDELLRAARAGVIVARRVERRTVVTPLDGPAEEVLGPDPSQDTAPPSKTWVGLVLVDQDSTPVPNRPYRVIKPDGTTVDGTLDSNGAAMLKDLDPGNCQIWCPYIEPHPETTYTVQPGDHLSGIAESFGFDDYTTVWNHPANADLQAQRSDPHVLQPGDSLTIPEVKTQAAANKPTSARHPFQIRRSSLKLRLTLLDLAVKAMPNVPVIVAGASLTTDGDGLVEATIDKSARDAILQKASGDAVDLVIGGLNPSDDTTVAGYKARLSNMGFLWDPTVPDTDNEMVIALQDFQAQYSLTVSGELDDATKAQLLQAHGS